MPTPKDPRFPNVDEDQSDGERKRLELEKLRLETESLRNSPDRDKLEAEKLRREIAEIKKAPVRTWISTSTSIVLGLATIFLGVIGVVLNTTINRAAEHQRDFDNYSKLTEQFSKGGSARVGAIVGFQKLLGPDAPYSRQVASLLANDLFDETDSVAVHGIVSDLTDAGMQTFSPVREVHAAAIQRAYNDAVQYSTASAIAEIRRGRRLSGRDVDQVVASRSADLVNSVETAILQREGADFYGYETDTVFKDLAHVRQTAVNLNDIYYPSYQPNEAEIRAWRARYIRAAAAAIEATAILGLLLTRAPSLPDQFDASEVTLLFFADWRDRRYSGINLSGSFISGIAQGADFSNSDLSRSRLALRLDARTSFCGANLNQAHIGTLRSNDPSTTDGFTDLDQLLVTDDLGNLPHPDNRSGIPLNDIYREDELPDFTGANWWKLGNLPLDTRTILEQWFPQADQERFAGLPRPEQVRICSERRRYYEKIQSQASASP
jgi:hypothetical protein